MKTTRLSIATGILAAAVIVVGASAASDVTSWPQYRGPELTGISSESGILESWPEGGPKVAWRTPLGDGYSGISVVNARAYTMYGNSDGEFVAAFDTADGKRLWQVRLDDNLRDKYGGDGPRSTPTVAGGMVYALGTRAILVALNTADGKLSWKKDLKAEFSAVIPQFGVSTSPLIENGLVLVDIGAKSGGSLLALDMKTGDKRWTAFSDRPGYSTPLPVDIHGVRQVLFFTGSSLASVAPADGEVLWSVPWRTDHDVNASMPILVHPDKVFVSSDYGKGAGLFQIQKDGESWKATEVWKSTVMKNHFNSSILHQGHIYGFDSSTLKCIEAQTGAEKWAQKGFDRGALLLADGLLLVLSEDGLLALAEATPSGYKEKARAQILEGRTWTMPSLAGGRLYLRNEKEMVALEITE